MIERPPLSDCRTPGLVAPTKANQAAAAIIITHTGELNMTETATQNGATEIVVAPQPVDVRRVAQGERGDDTMKRPYGDDAAREQRDLDDEYAGEQADMNELRDVMRTRDMEQLLCQPPTP